MPENGRSIAFIKHIAVFFQRFLCFRQLADDKRTFQLFQGVKKGQSSVNIPVVCPNNAQLAESCGTPCCVWSAAMLEHSTLKKGKLSTPDKPPELISIMPEVVHANLP